MPSPEESLQSKTEQRAEGEGGAASAQPAEGDPPVPCRASIVQGSVLPAVLRVDVCPAGQQHLHHRLIPRAHRQHDGGHLGREEEGEQEWDAGGIGGR